MTDREMPENIWADRSDDDLPQYRDTPFGIWWIGQRSGYTEYVRADLYKAERARVEKAEAERDAAWANAKERRAQVYEMRARAEKAEEVIKAAEALAGALDKYGPSGCASLICWDDAQDALAAFRQAQQARAALRQDEGGEND